MNFTIFFLPGWMDTSDALAGSWWFIKVHFSKGYWQVKVAEDRENTDSMTGRDLYQWWSMPMGLSISPATFQLMMELVLRALLAGVNGVPWWCSAIQSHIWRSSLRSAWSFLLGSRQQAWDWIPPSSVQFSSSWGMSVLVTAYNQTLATSGHDLLHEIQWKWDHL